MCYCISELCVVWRLTVSY